jgi:hypothetical protein
MKRIIQNNGILTVYLFSQLFVFIFSLQKDSLLGNYYKINEALFFHFLIIILVLIGYSFNKIIVFNTAKTYIKEIDLFYFKSNYLKISFILVIIGVLTTVLTIGNIVSPKEYLSMLITQNNDVVDIRQQSGDGGLSGLFKMMNIFPLAIYLITSANLKFGNYEQSQNKILKTLNKFSLFGLVIKILFSLDRISIMAIFLIEFFSNTVYNKIKIKYLIVLGFILFLGVFVTASRMPDNNFIEFIIIYCKLSIVNFQKVITNDNTYSLGFQTFLSPLSLVFKFFGFNIDIPSPNDWEWNPAQYFNSYLFMDFRYFSLIFYPIFGYFIKYIELKKKAKNKFFISSYFIFMFTVSTFISVPFIRGVEFWLCIIICYFLSKQIKFKYKT